MNKVYRNYIIGLVAVGFIVLNPLHLPWSMQWVIENQAGTPLGDFVAMYESQIIVGATVYFTAVMIPVYIWLWRRRRNAGQTPRREAPAPAEDLEPGEPTYRGPGGGKRLPPSMRPSASRRRRRRR
ncbi:MAG: hypothetical protein F4X20_06885 [Dehalococcoidia bacterium]|nr:hypothetical protein [Dehalococcoidia bacterium]